VVDVRGATSEDTAACVAVLAALPDFFTRDTHVTLADEMQSGKTWVAVDEARSICGFVHAKQHYSRAAEITFAAVVPGCRRRGIGRILVAAALDELREAGVAVVEVKTLDATSDYPPYAETRAFWESQGFVQVDMIDPLPGWEAGNPSAIYVVALNATRRR
jgi:ribosomal protein S18 acetylase RimI-like enzyme